MRFPWQKPTDPAQVANEFAEFLRKHWPQLQVKAFDNEHVELTLSDGTDAKLYLHKLHASMPTARSYNPKVRQHLYENFAAQMLAEDKQIPDLDELDAAQMAGKIFPRVMPNEAMKAWAEQAGEDVHAPSRPLADTDFMVVYVLDFDDRVAYVMGQQAESLGMDETTLNAHAMTNARQLFSRAEVEKYFAEFSPKKVVHFLECKDGHASARLLLLPEYLQEGEEVAAVILENSAFLIAQIPPSNNWNPLREVARPAGSPQGNQPFIVTREGNKAL